MILADRVALIVGGSESIGRAIAATFAEQGASTAICSRRRPKEPEVVAELRGRGLEAMWAPGDMTDSASMVAAVEQVVSRYGKLDILVVSGAPTNYTPALFEATDPADYHRIVDSQLISRLNCLHAALGPMISRGYGKVVFLATDAGRTPTPASAVSGAAAAGVIFFTRAGGKELARKGIRVNCIGVTLTAPTDDGTIDLKALPLNPVHSKAYAKIIAKSPFRLCIPADLANAALFLASPQSDQITGAVISVNGGVSFP